MKQRRIVGVVVFTVKRLHFPLHEKNLPNVSQAEAFKFQVVYSCLICVTFSQFCRLPHSVVSSDVTPERIATGDQMNRNITLYKIEDLPWLDQT